MGRGPRGMGSGGRRRLEAPRVREAILLDRAGLKVYDIAQKVGISHNQMYAILGMTVTELKDKYGAEAWPQ
jgi:hypothetical protein